MNRRRRAPSRRSPPRLPGVRRSLAATGGILLGPAFHHDMTRPGVGLYGGLPFAAARPVVALALPVIQVREVAARRGVGYGAAWTAPAPAADRHRRGGLRRRADAGARAAVGSRSSPATRACPVVGRVSMDLITADVTDLREVPDQLEILNERQTVDDLARAAGTIGYEILTSLGGRYERVYKGSAPACGPCMILLRLAAAFFASIGRSTLALLGADRPARRSSRPRRSRTWSRPPWYPLELGQQLLRIGYFSLPVVGLTALFTGAALALQIYAGGARFNAETVVPSIVAIGIVRELGPVLGGLMVAGRVSSSIAAELGTMRVTEQIDALTTLSTDPMKYLVVPRVLAATLALPALVAVGDVIGVFGGYLVGVGRLGFDPGAYIRNTLDFLEAADVASSLMQGLRLRLPAGADGLLPRLQLRPRRPRRRRGDHQRRGLGLGADPRRQLPADRGLLLMPTPKIELVGVKKAFGDKPVLAGVSLKVMPGESLVIIGGSGTGKSVTLKCILGILRPTRGAS